MKYIYLVDKNVTDFTSLCNKLQAGVSSITIEASQFIMRIEFPANGTHFAQRPSINALRHGYYGYSGRGDQCASHLGFLMGGNCELAAFNFVASKFGPRKALGPGVLIVRRIQA
jgi:hypothetical protein